ncbi:VWA domain-containing protein [Bdellovibrio bacteriovorus]|uniref:VWA domain-containing protein n=1 Tax=Bdellovibrio bacteriovorus TaxID=959 RepID=UPI003AA853DA
MKKQYVVLTMIFLASTFLFQNCSPSGVQFEQTRELASVTEPVVISSEVDTEAEAEEAAPEIKTKTFTAASKEKAVDMVWVIDNSASMTAGADIIRKNFEKFAHLVENQVDLRVALISKQDAFSLKTHVSLPESMKNGQQVDFMVHSYNPLLVAAAATCPETATDAFCKKILSNVRYGKVYSSLNDFFRPQAQKVFVFVTDDDSAANNNTTVQYDAANSNGYVATIKSLTIDEDYITAATFKDRMVRAFGKNGSYKVFGFIAAADSKCRARESTVYSSLISSSGGVAFNVCDKDWSKNFSQLSEKVVDYASTEYSLQSEKVKKVLSVTLNGQILIPGTDYTVVDGKISLSPTLVKSLGNYIIDVTYTE